MDSVKRQIMERALLVLEPLKAAGTVRRLARVTSPFLMEPIKPALHIIAGEESQIEEDNLGYVLEFPLVARLVYEDTRDPYSKGNDLAAEVQAAWEGDPQLQGLINWMKYQGEQPHVNEVSLPDAGVYVIYTVQYRRQKARPDLKY